MPRKTRMQTANWRHLRRTFLLTIVCSSLVGMPAAVAEEKVVDGVTLRWGTPEIPKRVAAFRAPATKTRKPVYVSVPAREFVPLGVYAGDFGDATWDFVFNQLRQLGGNSYYVNGSHGRLPGVKFCSNTQDGLEEMCRRAARMGVRIYYQDQSSPFHWPSRAGSGGNRRVKFREISKWMNDVVPDFATDPELRAGLLVWAPAEEVDESTARDPMLKKIREELVQLDPFHPAAVLVMSHTPHVQEALYESWGKIPITITDHYLNDRGVNLRSVAGFNLQRLKIWSELAHKHDSKFWLIVACFSMFDDLDRSFKGGYRGLRPEEVRMSLWTGLAYGASGFYLFRNYDNDGTGRACLTRFDWKPTEEYVAASRFFRRVRRLSPLVGKWRRSSDTALVGPVAVTSFTHPDYAGTFRVIANSDPYHAATYRAADGFFDLRGFLAAGECVLGPGDGRILYRGSKKDLKELEKRFGPGAAPLRSETTTPKRVQLWTLKQAGEGVFEKREFDKCAIRFGGKGAPPVVSRSTLPPWGGDLVNWGGGIKVPSRVYYPPCPGRAETVLHLKWDMSGIAGKEIERAVLTFSLADPNAIGRIGIYPVVKNGLGTAGAIEYMPRWETRIPSFPTGKSLAAEITGIVNEWTRGELQNRGLVVVFEGFAGADQFTNKGSQCTLNQVPQLELLWPVQKGQRFGRREKGVGRAL